MSAYLKVVFANGKQSAGVAALLLMFAVAVFSACGGSGDTVNNGDGVETMGGGNNTDSVEPAATAPVVSDDAPQRLPGTLVSGDWQITVSNYTRDGNIVTVPVELTNVGNQAQSPPATEFGNYAIIDDKGSEFSIKDGFPENFVRPINPGDSLPIIPLAFSVPAGASGLNFQFRGGYTSPEVLFRLEGLTSRIAFFRGGGIFTVFSDGSADLRQLTSNRFRDRFPAWSPDGTRIAFVSERNGAWGIYTMSSDGSDVRPLTDNQSEGLSVDDDSGAPSWSPDGSRIAFVSCCDTNDSSEIYTIASDGSDVMRLTDNQSFDGYPAWSPDGSRIAFVSGRDGGVAIYTMSSDGSDVMRLTDNQSVDGYPAWSPDGSRIAFTSNRDGIFQIYTMSSDGSDVRKLTDNPFSGELYPAWSPDDSRIAFVSDRDGGAEIYTMSSDGSDVRRILPGINVSSSFSHISWSPSMPLVDNFGGELVELDFAISLPATPGVGWAVSAESGESEIALAEHLASLGESVRMFGAWWCPHCHAQKELFGAEAWEIVKQVNYVECSPDNRQGVTPECAPFTNIVQGFPTWLINSYPTSGARHLEDLAAATGYTGPTDFRFTQP